MNILLINTHSSGGAAKACIRLHLALLKAGAQSRILFLQKENDRTPESFDFKSHQTRQERLYFKLKDFIHLIQYRKPIQKRPSGYEGFHPAASIYDITQHPAYQWADVINLHWVTNFLDFASFFKKNTKPVVWTLHDMWPFTGGYHYEKGFPIAAYKTLVKQSLTLKQKALSKKTLHIVSPSNWLLQKSQDSPVLGHCKHYNIPNSLNPCLFQPLAQKTAKEVLQLPTDKKIILFVADVIYNRRKGFELLLQAYKQLSKNNIALAVIGHYSEEPINAKNIYFLDHIANERLLRVGYSAADVYVIPSVEDNLPNTVIESLFCGRPVVGFQIGGIPEMIERGKNGYISPSIDPEALARTINKALHTSFDSQAIRKDATQKYHPELQARKYLELFNSLVPVPSGAKVERGTEVNKVEHRGMEWNKDAKPH